MGHGRRQRSPAPLPTCHRRRRTSILPGTRLASRPPSATSALVLPGFLTLPRFTTIEGRFASPARRTPTISPASWGSGGSARGQPRSSSSSTPTGPSTTRRGTRGTRWPRPLCVSRGFTILRSSSIEVIIPVLWIWTWYFVCQYLWRLAFGLAKGFFGRIFLVVSSCLLGLLLVTFVNLVESF